MVRLQVGTRGFALVGLNVMPTGMLKNKFAWLEKQNIKKLFIF